MAWVTVVKKDGTRVRTEYAGVEIEVHELGGPIVQPPIKPPPSSGLPAWLDTPVGRWFDEMMTRADQPTGRRMAFNCISYPPGQAFWAAHSNDCGMYYFQGNQGDIGRWAQDADTHRPLPFPDIAPPH